MTTEVEKPAAEATYEDLREKIIYQVEHYFGDFNLPKDKFLLSKTKENQGWIELDVLLTFNRLKNLTTDKEIIVKAVRSSESGLVEVSEDNVRLRRNPQKPLPESFKDEFVGKTVYVKGFPKDISLDELIEFFKPFEAGCVKMRRFSFDRSFKGSVFVLLPTVEAAKKLRETTGLKYKDSELLILMAQEYADKKAAEKDLSKKAKKEKTEQTGEDELGEMARVEQILEKMDKKPGVFMILRGLKKEYEITFQDIKGYFNKDDDKKVAYVELFPDEEKAVVRFSEEDGAVRARDAQDPVGRIIIKGHDIVAEALTGVAEKEQYRKQAALKLKRFENDRSNRKRAGQHRRQGYRGRDVFYLW